MAEKFTKVCAACGSRKITAPPLASFVPGAGQVAGVYSCRECGFTGPPVEVAEPEKYRAHLEKVRERKTGKRQKTRVCR